MIPPNKSLNVYGAQLDSKSRLENPKSRPGGSKIEAWGLQNRPWRPPRDTFFEDLYLRSASGGPTLFVRNDFEPK